MQSKINSLNYKHSASVSTDKQLPAFYLLVRLVVKDSETHYPARFAYGPALRTHFQISCLQVCRPPAQAIAYLRRLFENPEPALEAFADRQIAEGLTYLVNTMASGESGWFYSTEVPVTDLIRCVEAIGPFFERLFKPRCTPHLSHLSEIDAGPLNGVCYMWWDVFPLSRACRRSKFVNSSQLRTVHNGTHPSPRLHCLPGERERPSWARTLAKRVQRENDPDY